MDILAPHAFGINGRPQCGHAAASGESLRPQSGHGTKHTPDEGEDDDIFDARRIKKARTAITTATCKSAINDSVTISNDWKPSNVAPFPNCSKS